MDVRRTGPLVFVMIATLSLAACAPPAVPAAPTATWTQVPALVPTSTATPTPVPTATGMPLPTATATPRSTWTPTALPTATQTPTAQPQIELPIGRLAFVSPEQQILVREPAGAIRAITEEGIARSPAWSPDGTRLAFSYQADDKADPELRIYDFQIGDQTIAWTAPDVGPPYADPIREIAWSPSGRYLAFEQGCCPLGPVSIWDLEAAALAGYRGAYDKFWKPNEDVLTLSIPQPVGEFIPIGSGDSTSIALVRPYAISPTVVLTGTAETLYSARAWLSSDELAYMQIDMGDEENKTEHTWWRARIVDGEAFDRRQLDAPPLRHDNDPLQEHLSPWLPAVTVGDYVWSADGTWVVFSANQDGEESWWIYAFHWNEGSLVGPLAEGTDPALAPAHPSALPAVPTLPGLTIETYALEGPPQVEPLTFAPVLGTQEEVLAKRQRERDKTFPHNSVIIDGQHGLSVQLGGEEWVASTLYTGVDANQGGFQPVTVQVSRDGQIGISYDDQEMVLGYSSVPHYECCSAGERNPRKARNMVAFFAQRDERWYYVEIGAYE